MMKTYRVKEVFPTLQGEGAQTGTAAVFLRFAGCNAWTGRERDRERDLHRTGAACAAWCDTDFVGGAPMERDEVVAAVETCAKRAPGRPALVVCTGGEPLLQLDGELAEALRIAGFRVAVETNGSVPLADGLRVDWLTVSPKWLDARWTLRTGDELKLIVPAFDTDLAARLVDAAGGSFAHYFVQPLDGAPGAVEAAVAAVRRDPRWRLSLQTHKLLKLP